MFKLSIVYYIILLYKNFVRRSNVYVKLTDRVKQVCKTPTDLTLHSSFWTCYYQAAAITPILSHAVLIIILNVHLSVVYANIRVLLLSYMNFIPCLSTILSVDCIQVEPSKTKFKSFRLCLSPSNIMNLILIAYKY